MLLIYKQWVLFVSNG